LITSYGRVLGIILVLLLNSLVFQGILGVLVVILAVSSVANAGWKWAFTLSGAAISGFVGYWLGAKFLAILEWISALQSNRVNSSDTYAGLFWFGLAATICYIAMILVLRKSYGKLAERYSAVKGSIGSNSFRATERLRPSPIDFWIEGSAETTDTKSFRTNPDQRSGRSISYEAQFKHALIQMETGRKTADSPVLREKPAISPRNVSDSERTRPRIYKINLSRDTKQVFGRKLPQKSLGIRPSVNLKLRNRTRSSSERFVNLLKIPCAQLPAAYRGVLNDMLLVTRFRDNHDRLVP